jgi:acetylornithine deacetylase/succinyl-diaminopimelate desuccinylase-like protein
VALAGAHAYVDEHGDQFIELLRRLIRQPSVSSQNRGVRECADLIVAHMRWIGIDAQTLHTDGQPVVFGELQAARDGAPTL